MSRACRRKLALKGPLSFIRLVVMGAALLTIAASIAGLTFLIVKEQQAEEVTSGTRPVQFRGELDVELVDDYGGIFGIAHNAGDSIRTTREALRHGADIIEIDVISRAGKLYAGHHTALPLAGRRFFRGRPLEQVWEAAAEADVIKLDLKESSSAYLELVFRFLQEHTDHQVIVVSRSASTLTAFADRVPDVFRFLSVPTRSRMEALLSTPELLSLIHGVTVQQRLLDDETTPWLKEADLIVFAWTVNGLSRVNELVRLAVDGIITDNLAIMELLGGQERGERFLQRSQR